jgi:Rad3-related DNA helicase
MKYNTDHPAAFAVEDLSYRIFEFKKICECYDRHYPTFINTVNHKTSLLLYCLDPSNNLSIALERAVASVLFSATLTPTEYFADILGGGKKTVSVDFESPFPRENLCVVAVDKISTKYEEREKSYKKIASCIAATVSAKVGNYMVFFPSYGYMEAVHKIFSKKYPQVTTLVQKKNMYPSEREAYLSEFRDDGKLRIGFCVLGGSFSEGIDLPGKRLIGVVVVGVGLPGISDENNIIRDYYDEKCGMGYDYAYTYPGMNAVLQAVGRVIRTETDRGVAVLIDDRYAEPKYRSLFPKEWKGMNLVGDPLSLAEIMRRFWKN